MAMKHNKFIPVNVPDRLIDQSRDYGEAKVRYYARGASERSRKAGVPERPIDKDPIAQMMGKLCEVAGAIALGMNPDNDIKWHDYADAGWDFVFNGLRIDVKGTDHPRGKLLIWPSSKTHFYHDVPFNALMMVWAAAENSPLLGYCEARGWVLKDVFAEQHIAAGPNDPRGLEVGTWSLHQKHLEPMSSIFPKNDEAVA